MSLPMSISKEIFHSDIVGVGIFRCPTHHPAFSGECNIGNLNHVVFPRTSVVIQQAGCDPVVADPNVAVLYNSCQPYRRKKLSERGDNCDWFAVRPDVVLDAVRHYDPAARERPARPFAWTHAMVSPAVYLHQRCLLHYAQQCERPDPLLVEVNVMHLLDTLLSENDPRARPRHKRRRIRNLSEAARHYLASHFCDPITLSGLAKRVGCTVFHLAHVFRRDTGITLHAYLIQLRMRSALERVAEQNQDLTALAHELGFSSHSHFTSCFRQTFDTTPSAYRTSAGRRRITELRKFLIAR